MNFRLPRLVWGRVADALAARDARIADLQKANWRLRREVDAALREVKRTRAMVAGLRRAEGGR